jgi:formylglycine-generating enzyme required for sulfatase activity
MINVAIPVIVTLWAGPCRASGSVTESTQPAPGFEVSSSLPELPTATAPVSASAWNMPPVELPQETDLPQGVSLENVSVADLRRFDAAVEFEKGDAPPQEKAEKWHSLGRKVKALAGPCEDRAAKWEDYAAQEALNAVLVKETSEVPPDEKREAWLKLAKSYPKFSRTAQEQAQEWQRYIQNLAAIDAIKRKRAKLRDADWARLSKLLAQSGVSERDKSASAAAFVRAYGKAPDDDPYITELLPLLPKELLSAQDASALVWIDWVTLAGGTFVMGATDLGPASLPRHRVMVRTFRISRTLVTNKQYQACVQAGACAPPADCGEKFKGGDQPVVCVDWSQALAFSQWAGGRLPTEAEWEYAARGRGEERRYPWGDDEPDCKRAVFDAPRGAQAGQHGCARDATWPVCSKPKGNTRQGLCDMAGNVWEWLQDWYHDSYSEAPRDGSAWESPAGSERVMRGGAWNYSATSLPSAGRSCNAPDKRVNDIGFRLAQSIRQ